MQLSRIAGACLIVLAASASAAEPTARIFPGLGPHRRAISTSSPEAQRYFDQGMAFLYAFNHDEAIRSLAEAARLDPQAAMTWWGLALANGPHINNPTMTPQRSRAAWDAWQRAHRAAERASPVERALVEALGRRYAQTPPDDRAPLDAAYAEAMREVWRRFPGDADVGALFAEALMDLRPWDLWDADGTARPETPEVVATLEAVLELEPAHPLALHLMIHAVEASRHPGDAETAANRLRNLAPGLGHLVHMPSHIDVRLGNWDQAVTANLKAIAADRAYRGLSTQQDFYRIYMAHNHHMLAFAATMRGQSAVALAAVRTMVEAMPREWIEANALMADGFLAMPLEILVRFGRWQEVLAAPEPPASLPLSRVLYRSARGVALAALGDVAGADAQREALAAAAAQIPAEAVFGNNKATAIAAIAEHLLAGEALYRAGQVEQGLSELAEAVALEDALHYDEPPGWIHPVRHALGATLTREGRTAEAEDVYRADLERYPENGWALFGLAESLRRQGRAEEAAEVEARFRAVWIEADVEITSSCYCQPGLSAQR